MPLQVAVPLPTGAVVVLVDVEVVVEALVEVETDVDDVLEVVPAEVVVADELPGKHCEYQSLLYVQVPLEQQVAPDHPEPPHCPLLSVS